MKCKYALGVLEALDSHIAARRPNHAVQIFEGLFSPGRANSSPLQKSGHPSSIKGGFTSDNDEVKEQGKVDSVVAEAENIDIGQLSAVPSEDALRLQKHLNVQGNPNAAGNTEIAREAARFAKRLYEALSMGGTVTELGLNHFVPFFDDIPAAAAAFHIFDVDGSGSVTRKEVRERTLQIFLDRANLNKSLADLSHAIGKLDRLLTIVTSCILIFVWMVMLNDSSARDIVGAVLSFGSLFLGASFIVSYENTVYPFSLTDQSNSLVAVQWNFGNSMCYSGKSLNLLTSSSGKVASFCLQFIRSMLGIR
jgi:hypothetical protein